MAIPWVALCKVILFQTAALDMNWVPFTSQAHQAAAAPAPEPKTTPSEVTPWQARASLGTVFSCLSILRVNHDLQWLIM